MQARAQVLQCVFKQIPGKETDAEYSVRTPWGGILVTAKGGDLKKLVFRPAYLSEQYGREVLRDAYRVAAQAVRVQASQSNPVRTLLRTADGREMLLRRRAENLKEERPVSPQLKTYTFAYQVSSAISDFLDEVQEDMHGAGRLELRDQTFGLTEDKAIPAEVRVLGYLSVQDGFFSALLGDPDFELVVDTRPLKEVYSNHGIKTTQAVPVSQELADDLYDDLFDQYASCECILTLRVHDLAYEFRGNLRRGVTRQGWANV
jgi:hypothetical protein